MIANCEHCGAPIIWVTTQDGKRMSLDAAPLPDTVLEGWVMEGTVARPYDPLFDASTRPHHQAHAQACPKGGESTKRH